MPQDAMIGGDTNATAGVEKATALLPVVGSTAVNEAESPRYTRSLAYDGALGPVGPMTKPDVGRPPAEGNAIGPLDGWEVGAAKRLRPWCREPAPRDGYTRDAGQGIDERSGQ